MNTNTYPTRVNWWTRLVSLMALMILVGAANAQITITCQTTQNNGSAMVTFNFTNTNADPVQITDLSAWTSSTAANSATLWWRPTPIAGNPLPLDAGNGWTAIGPQSFSVPAGSIQPLMSGIGLNVPGGATYGLALALNSSLSYQNTTGSGITFSNGGCTVTMGLDVGWGGTTTSAINERGFTGTITFVPLAPCSGLPSAGTISGPSNICSGNSTNLTLAGASVGTGLTYQWMSSSTPGGPYTNAGTGFIFNTGPVTSTTYYVCEVTCSNGGLSSTTPEFTLTPITAFGGGTFTIDNTLPTGGSNFNSFTDAINFLNSVTACAPITGPVVMNVAAGQVFNENTPVMTAAGSPGNTITFQRSGVGANPVITPTGSAGTTDAGITISGGDHIVFNGIDIDASAVATVEYGYLIRNRSATDGATFNVIENCTVRLNRTNTTSRGILQSSTTTGGGFTPTDFAGANSANTYRNLTIRNCFAGIWLNGGSTTFYDDGNVITTTGCGTYNSIGDPNVFGDIGGTGTALQSYGVQMTSQVNFTVANCEIRNVSNTTSQLDGINITLFAGQCTVSNNIIRGIAGTGSTTLAMSGMRATHSTTAGVPQPTLRVYNNAISEITRAYTGAATGTRGPRGLYFLSTSALNTPIIEVWNNTVVIDGSANPLLSNACFEHTNPITGTVWTIRNNIFQNNTSGQTGLARHYGVVHTPNATTFGAPGTAVSHNDVFIADGVGVTGFTALSLSTTRNGVTAWQTAVAQATNNVEVNALLDGNFVSSQAALDGAGFAPAPAYLTVDLNCAPRQNDIGANNIDACVTPVAGTIGGSNSACDLDATVIRTLTGASSGLGISYQWRYSSSPGGPYDILLGTGGSQDFASLGIGTYYVVADVNCSAGPTSATTPEFTLTVNPNPTSVPTAVDATLCVGQDLDLLGSSDFGTTWAWTGPNGFASALQNPSVSDVTLADAGNYTLVTTANGCSSPANPVGVSVDPNPIITSVTATPNPICLNGSSQLNAIATLPGYSVSAITYAAQPITGFVNGPSGDDVISGSLALPFTFNFFNEAKSNFFINTNGQIGFNYVGSTAAQQRIAQVVPNATLPNDNISLCWADLNPTAGQITYGTIGTTPNRIFVVSYLNVPFFGGTGIVSGQIHLYETTNVVEVHVTSVTLNTANKTIGLENAAGNDGAAAPGRNGVNWLVGAPEAWRFTPNEPTYSWSPNTFLDFDNIANPEASGVTANTAYIVTATSPAGCTAQDGITVTIGATLSSVNIAPVAPEYCAGSSVLLTATPVDGGAPYTYQWFDPSNNPMGTDATQAADQPGLWTVILNDACGAPPVQASVTVIEKPTPSASATASQACVGGTLNLDGTTDFGTSVAWTGPNGFNSILEDPSISPVVAANAGTYSFTATFDGCTSAPATVIVAVDDSPIITSTTASPNPVCTGNDSQLNVNVQTNSYCTASITGGACTGDEYLSNVTFAGINNNSGCTYGAPNQGYNDFTAISGNVVAGSTYTLDFTIDQHFSSDQAALFVDWNQDGDFLDLNETYAFPTTVAGVNTQSITVPAGALNGNTRMRMRLNFAAAAPACGGTTFGEIEDYSLLVTGGGPAPGTVSFAWSPSTFLSADDIANPVAVAPLGTTAYSVLVTGGNGCTATGNVTLTVNESPGVELAAVPDCANSQFSISVLVTSTGNGPTVDLSYTVNGGSPIGVPGLGFGPQTPLGPFNAADDVEVTVIDPIGGCNVDGGVFRSGCPEIVNCPAVLTKTHCYDNNDTKTWYFKAANPGETLTLTFIAGTMDPNDLIRGYSGPDNNGLPIVELTGSFADLGVPQVIGTSLGDELFLEIDSDGSNSCQDSQQSSWLFEVECTPGCVNPIGSVNPIPNCVAQNFTIAVTADFVGDGAFVDIEYIVDGGTPVVIPGVLEGATENIGPFDFGQSVQVFLNHETDNACNLNLGFTTLTQSACPNEIPCSAWILGMNPNYTCATTSAGNMTGSTLAPGITGGCTGVVQDQWYRFTATATTHRVQLGGTTTGLSHSIFTGNPDCTNLQLVAGTACVAGATASNPAGLTIGQTYYVRVSRTTVGTNAYTVCVSAPPLIDADATVLALPLATACYGANETVSVTVLNNAIYPLDMSVNPLTVNVNVTGAVVTSLSGTINTGVVAPGATINVPMSTTLNMSAAGAYTFNGACVVVGDGNAANDPMTAATRTTVAPFAVPFTQNFTGFTGANLATLVAPNNGWREGNGVALPAGTTSTWTSSVAAQQTALGSGVSARIQMTTTARNEWIVSPKFIPVLGTQMSYRIALTEFGTGGADAGTPSPGMQPGDQVIVKVSTDCGASFNTLFTHNATTPTGLTNALQNQLIDLSGFAGQEVIIAFHATKPASTPHPNYDFHLDDINIQNVAVCSGTPTAGSANSSNAGPACAPASTTLSVSGQSTDGGIVVTWWGSITPGGPYTINQGSGTVLGVSGLTATRYWRASVKCTLSGDSALTAEVSTVVTPTPSANASAGPACTDQTLNLFGATDFGTSFTWSGPNSFNSTAQNPSIASITSAAGGTYTFTASANGCSTSSQVVVAVNTTPVITSLTATPNPVCIGDDSQLQAVAPVSGYFMGSGGASFIDISGTGTPVTPAAGDDTEHNVTIPGGFTFNGTSYTDIRIGSNGVVVFGSTTGDVALTNAALPSTAHTAGNVFLAPYWDDLDDGPATPAGNIYTEQVGDVFIIQWQTYPHFSAVSGQNITFQVQLNLLTNVVYFVYQDVIFGGTQSTLDAGLSATVGIQWAASAGNFIQYSFNTASLVDGQVISFTPNQANFQWTPSTYLTADNIADPIAQNVLANETYSVVATAANGCASAPLQITLEANPAMAAGQAEILPVNASFCTGSNVTLTANPLGGGGPYTFAWTDPNSNPAGTDATQLVNQTGTWSVVINDNCGGTASASIVVSEFPVPVATAGSTEPACSGAPVNFTATSTVVGSTFAWSGPGGFNSTDQNPVIASATLANSGTYSVVASANGCSSVPATTVVNVNTTPSVPVVNPAVWSLCPGGSVDLAASSGAAGTGTIGNGAIQNTGTTFPTPYGAFWESVRTQYLLLPADLSAMGAIPGGTLSSIGFFVADVGTSGQHTAYTIRMGNSAATSLSIAAFETVPATPVFGPVNYQPVAGLNTHVLSTPFVWTGGSVIVDICHSNDPDGTGGVQYTNNAVINSTATAFTSAIWKNNDNIENCLTVDAPLGSSLNRANMTFGYSFTPTLTWSPATGLNTTTGPLVTATPASTTTYTVSAENEGCIASADAIVHIGNNELALEVSTDANGDDLSYEFREEGTNTLFYAVGQNTLPNNALSTNLNCLPDGCYYLVVMDAGGDGILGGGYLLRENDGSQRRIIDNRRDAFGNGGFTNGGFSQIAGNEGFCLPLGSDRLVYTSCDKLDWRTSPCGAEYVVATDNATVTAQYGVNNANSGYQMWWYDPNGGYSFKRFQSHSTNNGLPASATRACHFLINSWSGNQLQQGVLYNVKVRGRVNGDYLNWGYACRFMVSDAAAQCPRTKLMDLPGNQYLSCGQSRTIASNQLVHARNVRRRNANCNWVNANRYQFRFRIPAENVTIVKTSATGQYWTNTLGLTCGKTYEVDVRASFDNGATWCHSSDPYGDVCQLTTLCSGSLALEANNGTATEARVAMYPNPNRGDQLFVSMSQLEEGVETVSIDIYDGFGKRVVTRTIAAQDGFLSTVLDLDGTLANGMYLVSITAGGTMHNERLVIQK